MPDRSCLCLVSGLCLVTQANNLQANQARRDAAARLWLVWFVSREIMSRTGHTSDTWPCNYVERNATRRNKSGQQRGRATSQWPALLYCLGLLFHRVDGSRCSRCLVGGQKRLFHRGERDQSRIVTPDGRWNHTGGLPSGSRHTGTLQGAATVAGTIGRELVGFAHGVAAVGHKRENGRGLVNEGQCLVGFGIRTGHNVGVVLPACRAGFFGIGHTGADRGLEYKARRGRVTDCHLSATSPEKQNRCQPAKTQCLTLTLFFRDNANVKENRLSGQKKPIYK